MAIDHPQVPVCCLSNGYMLDIFPLYAFRKFPSVYQRVTSAKRIFFESDMYFSESCFCNQDFCCNFAIGKQKQGLCNSTPNPYQIPSI